MSKHRKHWSVSDKLEILNYYELNGIEKTKRQYGISGTSVYKWRDKFEKYGEDGLSGSHSSKSQTDAELEKLRRENRELKAIVAEKELTLRIQQELLKKSR